MTVSLDLQILASRARTINHANGWGTEFTLTDVPTALALIHTEITEAHQAFDLTQEQEELADVVIRALDLSELIRPGGIGTTTDPSPISFFLHPSQVVTGRCLLRLHGLCSAVTETYRKAPDSTLIPDLLQNLRVLIGYALAIIDSQQRYVMSNATETPLELVSRVIERNATRPHRHGGRRA